MARKSTPKEVLPTRDPRAPKRGEIPPVRETRGKTSVQIGRKTVQTTEGVLRDAEILELRSQGWSISRISDHVKVTPATVQRAIERAVAAIRDESARAVRERLRAQLDIATNVLVVAATTPNYVFHQGEILVDSDGNPVVDRRPNTAAASALVRAVERYARLDGVDAPDRSEISITRLPDHVEKLIRQRRPVDDEEDTPDA